MFGRRLAPVAAASPPATAAAAIRRRSVVTDGDSDEDTTPPSPKVKVEPAEQLAKWAALDEITIDIDGMRVPLPDGCPMVVDVTGDDGGEATATATSGDNVSGGGRGGRGVPKRCSVCKQPKKGGCSCVKTKAKGK